MFDLFRIIVWFVFGMSQVYLSCVNIYSINTENPKKKNPETNKTVNCSRN